MALIVIIIELIALSILSRRLTQNLYTAVFLITKSRPIGISFLSLLFFPGTVIHELAHLFTAEILGVKTGGLTLIPEGLEQREVRTGSVMIAKSDPFRRAAIGIAPVFWGLGALGVISYFLVSVTSYYVLFTLYYLLFAVSNTMFSSKEDLEGFLPVVIVAALIVGSIYLAGIRISFTTQTVHAITKVLQSVATYLGYVSGLNIALFLTSHLAIRGVEKMTGRRLTPSV